MSPVDIAYVQPSSLLYGAEQSLLAMVRQLDRSRFTPHLVLVVDGPLRDRARHLDIDTTILPWLGVVTPRRPLEWARAVVRLAAWLRRRHVALVEQSLSGCDGGALYAASRLAGARFIFRSRGVLPGRLSPYHRAWLSRADRIVAVSRGSIDPALFDAHGVPWLRLRRDRIVIVPSGRDVRALDAEPPASPDELRRLGIPPAARLVGMVAAIYAPKRQDLFLRAAALVAAAVPQAWFLVVGNPYSSAPEDTAYARAVRQLTETLELGPRVVFTGYRPDAIALMKRLDVLVLPSESEAMGGVLVEAAAVGVPVIASAAGGIPETVSDGETGLLIRSDAPADYAAAIVALLTDAERARAMGAAARRWARRFDSAPLTRLVEACYAEVLGSRLAPTGR
jgi:glycosyltransferase involved in cell wall biosynthesis